MRIRRYRKKRDFPVLVLKLALTVALLCLCVTFFYNRIRPVIISAAGHQARVEVTRVLNSAITEELTQNRLNYSDIVKISRDGEGRVTSVETDSVAVNTLKAKIVSVVLSRIRTFGEQDLSIPIGSLSSVPFFLGKGPRVDFKITSSGYADARFESEFISSGINQTLHRIKLIVSADIYALVPGFVTSAKVTTDYYIAETVIVGVTPDFFADFN